MKIIKIVVGQVIVVVLALTIYSIWSYPDLRTSIKDTWRLATTRIPENLTELYFEDHLNLPKTVPDSESVPYAFTIHNLENKRVEYTYVIYAKNEKGSIILTKDQITIDHDKYETIKVSVPPSENIRTRIVVQLTGESTHEIAFWMEARK